MYVPKFKQSTSNLNDADYAELCQQIIAGLTDNPYYPTVSPVRDDFKVIFDKYWLSIPSPVERNGINTAAKRANRTECTRALLRLIAYVTYESNFNEEAMKSSNIPMMKKPQPKGLVGLVEDLGMTSNGEKGMIMVHCKADPNATKYLARVSTDGENWFAFGFNTSRTVKVKGLPTETLLYVQMQLENGHGTSPWSASITGRLAEEDVIATIHR